MIPIEHIQFAAITLTGFLTLMLFFIPSAWLISYTVVSFYSYGLDRRHLNTLQQVERTLREGEQQQQTATSDHNDRHELHEQDLKRITGVTPQEFQTR